MNGSLFDWFEYRSYKKVCLKLAPWFNCRQCTFTFAIIPPWLNILTSSVSFIENLIKVNTSRISFEVFVRTGKLLSKEVEWIYDQTLDCGYKLHTGILHLIDYCFITGQITDQLMSGVSVRVYEPLSSIQRTDRPVFVFMHGGGWTFLSIGKCSRHPRRGTMLHHLNSNQCYLFCYLCKKKSLKWSKQRGVY